MKRVLVPVTFHRAVSGRKQGLLVHTAQRADEEAAEIAAGINGSLRSMSCPRTFSRAFNGVAGRLEKEHWDWGQSHQRAVSRFTWVGRAGERIARALEGPEGLSSCVANIKTVALARHVPLAPPFDIPLHLIAGIEAPALGQAGRQTQRHRSVVRPLPWFQAERSAADHIGQPLEAAWRLEFERGADGIADGQA